MKALACDKLKKNPVNFTASCWHLTGEGKEKNSLRKT